jgi:hypothetical protein
MFHFEILPQWGKLFGRVKQGGKTPGAKINLASMVLQGDQGNFFFRAVAVLASFHHLKRFL